jgi:hypothetical protein
MLLVFDACLFTIQQYLFMAIKVVVPPRYNRVTRSMTHPYNSDGYLALLCHHQSTDAAYED